MSKRIYLSALALFSLIILASFTSAYTYYYPDHNYGSSDNYEIDTHTKRGTYVTYTPSGYDTTSYYSKTTTKSYEYPQYQQQYQPSYYPDYYYKPYYNSPVYVYSYPKTSDYKYKEPYNYYDYNRYSYNTYTKPYYYSPRLNYDSNTYNWKY